MKHHMLMPSKIFDKHLKRPHINMTNRHQHMALLRNSSCINNSSSMSLSISTQALSIQQSKVSKYLIYFWGPIFQTNKKMAMISTKKLIKMARRWQKFAAVQRKRISFSRTGSNEDNCSTCSSSIVEKGHLAVYTADQACFTIPLAYLETEIIKQLLNISKEVFGLPSDGPITLPCDSAFDYIISLIKKGIAAGDLHKALLLSIPS